MRVSRACFQCRSLTSQALSPLKDSRHCRRNRILIVALLVSQYNARMAIRSLIYFVAAGFCEIGGAVALVGVFIIMYWPRTV
jgi:hypothetical protein